MCKIYRQPNINTRDNRIAKHSLNCSELYSVNHPPSMEILTAEVRKEFVLEGH